MKIGRAKIWVAAGLVAFLAVAATASLAAAQTPPAGPSPTSQATQNAPRPIRLSGTVSTLSSAGLVLTTKRGTFTVNVSADTWIVVQKNGTRQQGSLSDIAAGKAAVVAGMTTGDPNVIDARLLAQGNFRTLLGAGNAGKKNGRTGKPGKLAKLAIAQHTAAGTIISISGNTVTLKGAVVPQVIVQTTGDTVVLDHGLTSLSALKIGDKVQVFGEPIKPAVPSQPNPSATPGTSTRIPASRTINAWGIRVDDGATRLMIGRVTAINGTTLTVKTASKGKNDMIAVGTSTGYKLIQRSSTGVTLTDGTLASVTVGSNVLIEYMPATAGGADSADAVLVILPNNK